MAELLAMLYALLYCVTHPQEANFLIVTDSLICQGKHNTVLHEIKKVTQVEKPTTSKQ